MAEPTLLRVRLRRGRTVLASPELIKECRDWMLDCEGCWKEDREELLEMTDEEVVRGVDAAYEGGIKEVASNAFLDPPVIEHDD